MSASLSTDLNKPSLSGGHKAWLVCLSAGLFFFYEFFQLNVFDVINQPLRLDFKLNASQLSWMSSTYLWADILFLLPAGIILDLVSARKVILVAMIVCIIGTSGFALTHSFIWACFYHFLSGIGNAFCFLSCVVLITQWFPPRRQALVIGAVVTLAFLGGMMAHTPFAMLNNIYGWRNSLLVDALFGVGLFLWIALIVKEPPNFRRCWQNQTLAQLGHNLLLVLTNRQTWLAGCYTSLLNLPIMVLCALWGASYLEVAHHLTTMSASNVVSLIFVGSIIGCPLLGWLSDRYGRRKPLMIAGAVATLIVVTPLGLDINLPEAALGSLFFILGFVTSTQVISYPLIAESNSVQNTGAATGIASVVIMGGAGIGQVLFGFLIQQHAGSNAATYLSIDFHFAMLMFPLAAIMALIAALLTSETYCKRAR